MSTDANIPILSSETPGAKSVAGWTRVARWPALAFFFAVAAVVQTWPLAKHSDDSITTWWFFPYDAWAFLWNMWWVKYALVDLQTNPFQTDYLLYPQGSDLYLHPLTFINGLMSLPLQLLTGNLILSWNLLALLCFVLSGLGAYALCYRVTRNHFSGVLAGYVFAFAPFILMRFGGHWNVFATWPIPLLMLFLLRFRESGRLRDAAAAGVCWAILTLNWLEFATDAAIFLALFFSYWLITYMLARDREHIVILLRGAAVIIVVWFVISSPMLIPAIQDVRSGDYFLPAGEEQFSGDLASFVSPSPLWGPGTTPAISDQTPEHLPPDGIELTAYLGILPLLLAGASLLLVRRSPHLVLIWLLAFLIFAILSLGPYLYINDTKHLSVLGIPLTVPLPYQLYEKLPLLGERRVPARMIVFAIMALAVLAGIGLDLLMGWLRPRSRLFAVAIAVVAISLVALEYWNPPVYLTHLATPEALKEIAREPGDFAVLHAPAGRRNGWTFNGDATGAALVDYYQTVHEKPSPGGYISRVKSDGFDWLVQQPGLHYLGCPSCPEPPSGDDLDRQKVRKVFEENRIKYVIVHRLGPEGNPIAYVGEREIQNMDSYLRDVVGFTQTYSDEAITIYRDGAKAAAP